MSAFKKMAIVSIDEMDRIKQKQLATYNPELRVMARLQEEIEETLARTDLDAAQKIALIQSLSHKFQAFNIKNITQPTLVAQKDQPVRVVHAPAPAAQPAHGPAAAQVPADDTPPIYDPNKMPTLPPQHQSKAASVLDHIASNPSHISWDDTGQLVVKGEVVKDTNMSHLLRDLFIAQKGIEGRNVFHRALADTNIDPTLITSTKAFANIHSLSGPLTKTSPLKPSSSISAPSSSLAGTSHSRNPSIVVGQEGTGFVRPPGKRSNILHVYKL